MFSSWTLSVSSQKDTWEAHMATTTRRLGRLMEVSKQFYMFVLFYFSSQDTHPSGSSQISDGKNDLSVGHKKRRLLSHHSACPVTPWTEWQWWQGWRHIWTHWLRPLSAKVDPCTVGGEIYHLLWDENITLYFLNSIPLFRDDQVTT